ncbi:hypothetical protein [Natrialba swarupiae]|uniref:Uncharacterized protein n=1 Tax=Natrialba swarupiae TaxID=2448032 RepID=A0A5D5AWC8_9EURY|nr:hypothetical protein [Natrialba swarupiae]TYT63381.1 hypothetical protein FYC77_02075 [Natrialba swarupiae]
MSHDLEKRVDDVLERADAAGGSAVTDDGESVESLLEVAADADEILASAEPAAVLEAVGLDRFPDGSEPESIPAAIAHGDPTDVEVLDRLISLSRLSEQSDADELEGTVGALRETLGESGVAGDEGETVADESEVVDGEDEGSGRDPESAEDGDLGDRLRSAMSEPFETFGDEVDQLRDRLEEAGSEAVADAGGEENADDQEDGRGEEDDGFLEPDLGSDDGRGGQRGGADRHSTVAPSPSDRPDMNAVKRFSTMPDRNDR